MPANPTATRVTVPELAQIKRRGEKIVALTAYDASFAACADRAGIDFILVGDSLGMVVQGRDSTLPVTVDDIVYHTASAARGIERALLVADLPFMAYRNVDVALVNSARLMAEGGAAMVKLEGGGRVCAVIAALKQQQIPVCAHLGLTPQSVHAFGGFRVQGRDAAAAAAIKADALAVEAAGADALVLECVPGALAAEITRALRIPTIGIGAGVDCDGQVLVLHDLLGVTLGKRPRFARNFLAGHDSVDAAMRAYTAAVRDGLFPAAEHSY